MYNKSQGKQIENFVGQNERVCKAQTRKITFERNFVSNSLSFSRRQLGMNWAFLKFYDPFQSKLVQLAGENRLSII